MSTPWIIGGIIVAALVSIVVAGVWCCRIVASHADEKLW